MTIKDIKTSISQAASTAGAKLTEAKEAAGAKVAETVDTLKPKLEQAAATGKEQLGQAAEVSKEKLIQAKDYIVDHQDEIKAGLLTAATFAGAAVEVGSHIKDVWVAPGTKPKKVAKSIELVAKAATNTRK